MQKFKLLTFFFCVNRNFKTVPFNWKPSEIHVKHFLNIDELRHKISMTCIDIIDPDSLVVGVKYAIHVHCQTTPCSKAWYQDI